MKKIAIMILMGMFICSNAFAADTKVSALTDIVSPAVGDDMYIVDAPDGSPLSRKINVGALFAVATDLDTDGVISANAVALTTDTTGNYANGDAEAGSALTGDAAVDFFGGGVTAVTDATACTDIEGTLLSIGGGTLNAVEAQTFAAVLALGADGNDVDQTSLGKLEGFDAGVYLDMDADGVIDLTSDGTLELHSADWDIGATGIATGMGNITSDGTVEGASMTQGGQAMYDANDVPGGELGGTFASFTIDDSITVTGWALGTSTATQITSPTLITDLIDTTGAADIDIGSGDVTDVTMLTSGGTYIFSDSFNASGEDLGSTTAEWNDLFLGDSAIIYAQADNSITMTSSVAGWTYGQFPITPSAAPDADYEVANKKYHDDNGAVEVNDLETVMTDVLQNEIAIGQSGGDAGGYYPVTGDVTMDDFGVTTIGADKILESMLKSVNAPTDEYALTYEVTTGDFEWVELTGGAEVNNLETICTDIATTEIPIGTGVNTVVYASLSGEATMDNAGAVTLADDVTVTGWTLGVATATSIDFDSTPGATLTYTGWTSYQTVDSGVTESNIGQAYHIDTDGELVEASASATTTMPCTAIGLASGTSIKRTLLGGYVRNDAWAWTAGGIIYVSTNPNADMGLTQTAPSATGEQVQVVGVAKSADVIYFDPSLVLVEIA